MSRTSLELIVANPRVGWAIYNRWEKQPRGATRRVVVMTDGAWTQERFFTEYPEPLALAAQTEHVRAFFEHHRIAGRKVVVVTVRERKA